MSAIGSPRPMLAFQAGACFVWAAVAAVLAIVTHLWPIWIFVGVFAATGASGLAWYVLRRRQALGRG